MLGRNTGLSKFGRMEIIQSMFSDHNGMKLAINNQGKFGEFTDMWKLNNIPSRQWVKEEITRKISNYSEMIGKNLQNNIWW